MPDTKEISLSVCPCITLCMLHSPAISISFSSHEFFSPSNCIRSTDLYLFLFFLSTSRNPTVMEDDVSAEDLVHPSVDRSEGNVIKNEAEGYNPGLIVLVLVGGLLLLFLVGNYALYMYAQKTLPPRKKKPVSKKKIKRERLKQGVSAPGE